MVGFGSRRAKGQPDLKDGFGVDFVEKLRKQILLAMSGRVSVRTRNDD